MQTTASPSLARANMVERQVRPQDVTDSGVLRAMRHIDRRALLPAEKAALAYADTEVEWAPGRWLLRPMDIARLVQALAPRAGEEALALLAPYGAAVLEALGLSVTRLDEGDLERPAGSYDVILCEGGVERAHVGWTDALKVGGRLGVVERRGRGGRAVLILRSPSALGRRDLFDSAPPVLAGFEAPRAFALEGFGQRRPGAL